MEKLSLRKIYNKHYKNKFSYTTFRTLFNENKDKFNNVEMVKFKRKTTYNILNEEDFINTFSSLIQIEKL